MRYRTALLKFGLLACLTMFAGLFVFLQHRIAEAQTTKATIVLTKSVDKTAVNPGDVLTYKIDYQNTGNAKAKGLIISDVIPSGTTYINGSASNSGSLGGTTLQWNIGTVSVGSSGTVSFKVTVNAASASPSPAPSPSPSPNPNPSPGPSPSPSPSPSPAPSPNPPPPAPSPGGSGARFTKPSSSATIDHSNSLSTNLDLFVPFNEGSGTSLKDVASGNTGTPSGGTLFSWVQESTEFSGPAVNFAGSSGAGLAATTSVFKNAPVVGYTYAILFKPQEAVLTSTNRMMDTNTTAGFASYINIFNAGEMVTSLRDASNNAVLPKYNFSGTTLPWILQVVTVAPTQAIVYANLSSGNEINGMGVQSTTAVSAVNSWARSGVASTFYIAGTAGGSMPKAKIAGEWIWRERVLSASEVSTFWTNPFAMLK